MAYTRRPYIFALFTLKISKFNSKETTQALSKGGFSIISA